MSERTPIVVANHKENLSWSEFSNWLEQFLPNVPEYPGTIIICPSNVFLVAAWEKTYGSGKSNVKLGAQDVSVFEKGANKKSHTGEITTTQLKAFVSHVIIGHSERRNDFGENDEVLSEKVKNTLDGGLIPIFCVQDETTPIPEGVEIVAYEPPSAIGSGNAASSEKVMEVASKIKERGNYVVLYGGSVVGGNVHPFLKKGLVDGVLVGGASLDPHSFIEIIKSATY